MAMFGDPKVVYEAASQSLSKGGDKSLLEKDQQADFFQGNFLDSALSGVVSSGNRMEILGESVSSVLMPTPGMTLLRELSLGAYDSLKTGGKKEFLEDVEIRKSEAAKRIKLLQPDPKTNGMASRLLFNVTDVFGTVIGSGGNPAIAGAAYGTSQAQVGLEEGLDPTTANVKGAIEGIGLFAGMKIPGYLAGNIATRIVTGGAANAVIGAATSAPISQWLKHRGFHDMAEQYAPLDVESRLTDVVLGSAFSIGGRGKSVKPKGGTPDPLPPSTVDAALTSAQVRHAEVDTAPGIPKDTASRNAHAAALEKTVEDLAMGRTANVEGILADAGFIGKRPDFDALKIITTELEKAGATDLVAQLRQVEADARARSLVVEESGLENVVLSNKPVESSMARAAERDGTPIRIGDQQVPAKLMLVDAGDVQATMMKADNQFRDRTRVASEQQISEMAARLDPGLLGDSPVMDVGAPVLAADGTIIGGNGRAAAITRAYEGGTADAYRESLRAEFGDAVDGMKSPMLVRVLQRDVDIQKAAILSNEGGGLRMSALEQAKVDGSRLGDLRAFEFSDDGDINLASNMPFIRQWASDMPQNQRAAIMDSDGRLSAEGAGRLRNAILYRAYGDSPTLARLVEANDPGSRNIAAALSRAAPVVADARAAIERGDLYPMGLHDDILQSVEKIDQLRRDGLTVSDWLKQIDAFGDGMTAEARVLVQFMDSNIRASRVMSDALYRYYSKLNDVGNPKQASMFEASEPDKARMLALALSEVDSTAMYSRGETAKSSDITTLTDNFRAQFGKDADALLTAGRIRVVQSVSDLPGAGHPSDVGGMFLNGESWIVADNTNVAQMRGRVLHEIGVHAGIQSMLGDALYGKVLERIQSSVDVGDPLFTQARALAEARANLPEHVPQETLAYLVENAPELPMVRQLLASVRQWLYRTTGGRFVDLTQADLQMMAVSSLRSLARAESVAAAGDKPWYMTLFHGTPSVFKPEEGAPLGRLRWKFINSGEGAQFKGYGHYMAQQEFVARTVYRDTLVARKAGDATRQLRMGPFAVYDINVVPTQATKDALNKAFSDIGVPENDRAIRDIFTEFVSRVDGSGDKFDVKTAKEAAGRIADWTSPSEVKRAEDWLVDQLNSGKANIEISSKDYPAYRIGDRLVHEKMGGEAKAYAYIAHDLLTYKNPEEIRMVLERDLRIYKEALASAEAGFTVKQELGGWNIVNPQGEYLYLPRDLFKTKKESDAAAKDYNKGFRREGGRGSDQAIAEAKKELSFQEAKLKALDDLLVDGEIRPDITEVKPEPPKGSLYGKHIPDAEWNKLMLWDAPMDRQPDNVKAAFKELGVVADTGVGAYKKLAEFVDDPEISPNPDKMMDLLMEADHEIMARREFDTSTNDGFNLMDAHRKNMRPISIREEIASVILDSLGVKGHRFLDGYSKNIDVDDPSARFNVVLYSDEMARVAWEAKNDVDGVPTEWNTANGRGSIDRVTDKVTGDDEFNVTVDGKEIGTYAKIEEATLAAEQALDGQFYSRGDMIEDTTMPNANELTAQADAGVETAGELSKGFMPAVECALRVGG